MFYLLAKAAISGLMAAIVSDIAKRSPAFGALVASLPLISVMAIIWLWRDTADATRVASQMEATFGTFCRRFLLTPAIRLHKGGTGILKIGKALGIGNGTVQRVLME